VTESEANKIVANTSLKESREGCHSKKTQIATIYVELKNSIESAVVLNKERVVIRGVDCRTLGALGMPFAVSLD